MTNNNFNNGFLKRAQEYGLTLAQGIDLLKTADRKQDAEDLIPQNTIGALGDYLTPGFSGFRAGKATALGKSLGHEPDFTVTNPRSSALIGSLLGAGAGGLAGHAVDGDSQSTVLGALLGGALGGWAPTFHRRGKTKEYLKEYAEGAKVNPKEPEKLKGIGNILLPFSGSHSKVEAVGYGALKGHKPSVDEQITEHLFNTLQSLGGISPAIPLAGGIGQNYSADQLLDKLKHK